MSEQYLGERINPPVVVEAVDQRPYNPVVNTDPFADKIPMDPALIHETPMGGIIAAVGPMNEPLVTVNEIPEGEIVDVVAVDEMIVYQTPVLVEPDPVKIPMVEAIPFHAPVSDPIIYRAPVVGTVTHDIQASTNGEKMATLLNRDELANFRTRWNDIQGKFVDEPRTAVQQADELVFEVIENITQMFAKNHSSLEGQWKQGNDVSTEDLRKALQQYRSFFNRLVV